MQQGENDDSLYAPGLDRVDHGILQTLQSEGRISNQDLARRVHLSPAQSNRRHRRLEEGGYIKGYEARLNAERLGLSVTAFVHVAMERGGQLRGVQAFQDAVAHMPQVLECYAISGDFDYVCKVVARDLKGLSDFLMGTLAQLPGVSSVKSSICLHELKCTGALPLD